MALIGSLVATVLGILSGIFLAFATIAVISVFSGGPLNFMNPLYLLWRYHARVTMWGQRAVWSMNSVREIGFPTRTIEERQRQPYVYEPLNLKERRIRLLRVTRCKYDHWESFRGNLVKVSFRGSLVEVSLDNPEFKYLAISYRWGDSKVVSTMPCDGDDKKLCITQSVLSILETVLQCGRTIHVWIDALCIDQKNLDEKSHQVGLMKDVYKNAYEVVVCLGEPTEDSNRAMDAIYPLKKAYHASQNSQTVSSPELPSLVYLGSLLRRPWFSRIWVIQEVAVASSVTIVCGNRAVRLSDFTDVLWSLALFGHEAQIRGHDRKTVNDSLFVRPPEGYTNGVRMAEIKFSLGQPKHMPFSEILMALCHFDSTNPRDKLYALLGFVEDEDLPFRPDYSESNSTENLYKTTASYMLQQDPSMYVLQRAGTGYSRSEALKDLPSWVPDWSSVDKEIKNFGSQKRSEFRAGGAQDRKPRWLNSELLAIDGIAIDTVAHMSSVRPGPPNGNKPNDPEKAALRKKEILQFKAKSWLWFRQAEDMVSSLQASGDTALWKDSEEKVYPIKGKEQETLRGAFTKTVISNERPLDAKPDDALYMSMWRRVVAFHEPDSPGGEVDGNTFNYNSTVTGSTSQRRFFTTKGGLMGLTSPGTRERDEKYEGDTVCIFQGAVTPFIIRKNRVCEGEGQTWTLVGEAYVHGLMEGEGRGNGMVMEEFVLK
jgi:hypothetical protein